MTGQLDQATTDHRIAHAAKFEGRLVWPDGAKMTPFAPGTRVWLYEKSALEKVVARARRDERPASFRDVSESGVAPVAVATTVGSTGYFFFAERDPDEESGAEADAFTRIAEWPSAPTRFYLAVEGAVVCHAIVGVAAHDGKPDALLADGKSKEYVVDPGDAGCLLEIEVCERWIGTTPVLVWGVAVALTRGGSVRIDVKDATWAKRVTMSIPNEVAPRLCPVAAIAVLPLLAMDTRPYAANGDPVETTRYRGDDRWSHHPSLTGKLAQVVVDRFNPPAPAAALRNGLDVDGSGKPTGRPRIVPRAAIDLGGCPDPDGVLDAVRVSFFEEGIVLGGPLNLRRLAFDQAPAAQIPFGPGECLAAEEAKALSRIKLFRGGGFPVQAPLLPEFTAAVDDSKEDLYEPLAWVSGGHFDGSTMVEYSLKRRGDGDKHAVPKSYGWPAGDSASPKDVLELEKYHRDLFRIGGTGGIFSSNRGGGATAHPHVGLDLYAFEVHPKDAADAGAKGEPFYAMMPSSVARQSTNGGDTLVLTATMGGVRRQLMYMHANPEAAPGLAHQSGSGPRPVVFRGSFLGFCGSTGNANGADVPSKHLHMYYRRADLGDNGRDDVATLFGAAGSPVPAWIVEAAAAQSQSGAAAAAEVKASHAADLAELQKNRYPWFEGKVTDVDGLVFPAGTVRAVLWDRTENRKRYVGEIAAISTADEKGRYGFYVPAGVRCEIIFCHKESSEWVDQPTAIPVSLPLGASPGTVTTKLGIKR